VYEKESSEVGSERLLYESKNALTPLSILPDGQMSVTLEPAGAGWKFGVPATLFEPYVASSVHAELPLVSQYAVSADGKRFLVARQLGPENEAPGETPLTVLVNWTSLLTREAR
jgi:hypothetical protein